MPDSKSCGLRASGEPALQQLRITPPPLGLLLHEEGVGNDADLYHGGIKEKQQIEDFDPPPPGGSPVGPFSRVQLAGDGT